ncbi:MAG: VOC family protein [Xanthomonadales bacterium]|jgi:catechol 2,3-dioxygenase-like lactoylglutathione lyase family enzyme|nr:VOC family protein [Xanthomonadales bacterium]
MLRWICLLALWIPGWLHADEAAVRDVVEPRGEAALVQRLEVVTLATLSLPETERFYRQGYGLEFEGPIPLQPQALADQRKLWGVSEDFAWEEYRLSRPATWGMPRIRVLALAAPAEPAQVDWSAASPGAQGIGFAVADAAALEARLRDLGFAGSGLRESDSLRSDASRVGEREVIHHGPDFVRALARERIGGDAYAPLDEATGIGGPAWLSITTADAEASLRFWTEVLDLEVRSDRERDARVRQILLYARGSRSAFVELRVTAPAADAGPATEGLPRGIIGAAFVVHDLPEVLERLAAAEVEIEGDAVVPLPMLATRRVIALRSPEGLRVELIEGG